MATKPSLSQTSINKIDLRGEWDGDPTSHVILHAKIEFVPAPNTKLRLLDLSNEGIELLKFDGPAQIGGEISILPHLPVEDFDETPRSLYKKGMDLSPLSTKRRLFPPSPTSTASEMIPPFDDMSSGLEDPCLPLGDYADEDYDGGDSRSPNASNTSISEHNEYHSATKCFDVGRAERGEAHAEMGARVSEFKDGSDPTDFSTTGTDCDSGRKGISTRAVSDAFRQTKSSIISVSISPKMVKGPSSKIPVRAPSLSRPSGLADELLLYPSEPDEDSSKIASAFPPKSENPQSGGMYIPRDHRPSLIPTTPRNEQFSPVRLLNTLPSVLNKQRADQGSQQLPKSSSREVSHEPGKQPLFFAPNSFPRPGPRGSRRSEQLALKSGAAITQSAGEKMEKSKYVSTWLEESEDIVSTEVPHSPLIYPDARVIQAGKDQKENDPTFTESKDNIEKPMKLPSPTPSSQLDMPWSSADELAKKWAVDDNLGEKSTIPVPELVIVEEICRDFYILSSKSAGKAMFIIEFDMKITLGPAQPGGWQLLKIPGLPVDQYGKGTLKLEIPHGLTKKRLDCESDCLLYLERIDTGCIADFNLAKPLVVSLRAVELLTSESRDNRVLNYETSVTLNRRRKLGTSVIVEYTAVCVLSLYQKSVSAEEGAIDVIISDGPGGYFEWTMENGNRDFRIDQKPVNASDIGTTKVRIFCKEKDLDQCFRITWYIPYWPSFSPTWTPKLFYEKPETQAEYVPSLRGRWGIGVSGGRAIEEVGIGESESFNMKGIMEKFETGDFGDWGYLGLPTFETRSTTYWVVHQMIRVVIFSMVFCQKLGLLIQLLCGYVPKTPMKVLLAFFAVHTTVVIKYQLGRLSVEGCTGQTAYHELECVRSEPRPGDFGWFSWEKSFIVDRGLFAHVTYVVGGGGGAGEVTLMEPENDSSGVEYPGREGGLQIEDTTQIDCQISTPSLSISVVIAGKGENNLASSSTLELPLATPNRKPKKNSTVSEPTANPSRMRLSLRDRIDRFLGWKGPLE
ncbi:hypothetical protein ACO22_02294 [Paracoccidioides brasiliensis]|uniref:Uncharacterized protein n=1 Tax=Paracoccidioides brasiliensis TaxID=121759 RepID=A0A1D2JJ31_PARBR|nr:hypothetical protein ACO22_02294 [Paracoccidioides brasiliensis]